MSSIGSLVAELRYLQAVIKGAATDLLNGSRVKVKRGRGQRRNRRNR